MRETKPNHRHLLLRALCVASLFLLLLVRTVCVYAQVTPRMVVSRTKPEYPALALRMHIYGRVQVLAFIQPDGSVSRVQATSGHALLQGPAEQAVRRWRFARAATPSETTVEVQFAPQI